MPPRPITQLRKICLALAEAHEVEAWGEPTFRVRNKIFAMYASASNHHGRGRAAVWLKAALGEQQRMIAAAPMCFFSPPYVGPSGWIGIWLDGVVEWPAIAEFVADSYQLIAPKRLLEKKEAPPAKSAPKRKAKRPGKLPARKAQRTTQPR